MVSVPAQPGRVASVLVRLVLGAVVAMRCWEPVVPAVLPAVELAVLVQGWAELHQASVLHLVPSGHFQVLVVSFLASEAGAVSFRVDPVLVPAVLEQPSSVVQAEAELALLQLLLNQELEVVVLPRQLPLVSAAVVR